MFTKKISVFYLTKDQIKAVSIKLGKEPKILKSDKINWEKDSLTQIFKNAKKQLKTKSVRLLLADDLSHILSLNIPFDTQSTDEHKVIAAKLKEEAPEILESHHWDYQETGRKTQNDKQIIAFTPVKTNYDLFTKSLVDAHLKLETVEPEAVAKVRHSDPIIGIALKKDLKSKDKLVLNDIPERVLPSKSKPQLKKITDQNQTPETLTDDQSQLDQPTASIKKQPQSIGDKPVVEKKPPMINKTIIIIFLITLILGALIAGGILVQKNALQSRPVPTPSLMAMPTLEPSPLASPSASPEPKIVLSDYKILCLNGTGGKGIAGAVKDLLEAKGFQDIKADNAEKFDYKQTVVQLKKDTPEAVWLTIEKTLKSDYEVTRSAELLQTDENYDVVITVGELLTDQKNE